MKLNACILPVFLAGTLSGIYFLPKVGEVAQSAVSMKLPDSSNGWVFEKIAASPEEIGTLSADTEFSKAMCLTPRPGEFSVEGYRVPDRLDLSLVLSGSDLNNSIHRPERCMPAQGHNITSSSDRVITLANGRHFKAKRLVSVQSLRVADRDERAEYQKFNCLTYYFFVGHDQITNDHLGRTLVDMKDRLLKGMDQRWAYATVSMWYGKVPWIEDEVTVEEADEKIQKFLVNFAEEQINWKQVAP